MGYSVVAGSAIIAIAVLISFEILSGGILPTYSSYDSSFTAMTNRKIEQIHSNITIFNVSITPYGLNYNHSITIENTGSITLQTNQFTILLNGNISEYTVSENYLYPQTTSYFNLSNIPGDGEKKLKIISGNGIYDYYEYSI